MPVRQSDGLVPPQARTAVTSHIPHQSVVSKGIASIGYSKRLHILEIEFVNGAVYRYLQVAPSVHRDLMTADSKARYYDANIKGTAWLGSWRESYVLQTCAIWPNCSVRRATSFS